MRQVRWSLRTLLTNLLGLTQERKSTLAMAVSTKPLSHGERGKNACHTLCSCD